jgi:hypothetical protein
MECLNLNGPVESAQPSSEAGRGEKIASCVSAYSEKSFAAYFLDSKMASCVSPNAVRRRRYDGIFGPQPELNVRREDKADRRLTSVENRCWPHVLISTCCGRYFLGTGGEPAHVDQSARLPAQRPCRPLRNTWRCPVPSSMPEARFSLTPPRQRFHLGRRTGTRERPSG